MSSWLAFIVYNLLYLLFWSATISGRPGLPKFQLQSHLQVERNMWSHDTVWSWSETRLRKRRETTTWYPQFVLNGNWYPYNCNFKLYSFCTNPPPESLGTMVYLSVLKPAVLCEDSWMHAAVSQCFSVALRALLSEAAEEEPTICLWSW